MNEYKNYITGHLTREVVLTEHVLFYLLQIVYM
jgi:hypothetical protein